MVISDIESREQLAFLLNIPLSKLTYLLYVKKIDNCYTSLYGKTDTKLRKTA